MRLAQTIAGISLAEADVLRKAVGKKDAELIKKELGKFVEKSIARGFDRKIVEELSGQIETFGRYGFNKSHSVAYSVVSFHTAYLKAHFPAEFMAAILSSSIGDTDSVVKFINETREMGIEVLPPDVNESGYKFTVLDERRIRFGLGAIRNVGKGAIDSILAAKRAGPFTSFFDLIERIDLRACNRRVFEAMIASGALDRLGGHRAQYWSALDAAMQEASLKQQEKAMGQVSMFGGPADGAETDDAPRVLPNVAPMAESERLTREKEILGFYISGHPLEPYRIECELFATHTVSNLGKWVPEPLSLGVVVTAIKRQISKRSGAEFARLTVEDFSGSSEVLVFPESWGLLADRVRSDVPVLMKGGYSKRDQDADSPTFIVESVTPFAELRLNGQVSISIELGLGDGVTSEVMSDVRAVIDAHATPHTGAPPLELRWNDGNGTRARLRSRSLRLAATQAALTDLRALLGNERVRLVRGS
jgi:DNA polymerase III subunit alpha